MTDKELIILINKTNDIKLNEKEVKENFEKLYKLFSFFYYKKTDIKRLGSVSLKNKYKQFFHTINIDKIEKMFFHLENIELNCNICFKTIEGKNLLRRCKAMFLHSKKFFS